MIDIDNQTRDLYLQNDSIYKEVEIEIQQVDFGFEYGGSSAPFTFTNEDIVTESLEIEQNLCDGELDYVGCVASKCTFSLYERRHGDELPWPNFWITPNYNYRAQIKIKPANGSKITVWTGFVTDMEANFVNGEIKYVCYDIFGTEEFKKYKFGDDLFIKLKNDGAMSVKSVLLYLSECFKGISYENIDDLANNFDVSVQECFKGMEALELLKYICQMNGRFGVVKNDGRIEFRKILDPNIIEIEFEDGTYPGNETYPGDETYPGIWNSSSGSVGRLTLPYATMESNDRMRYEEQPIDGVLIMETESTDVDKSADNRKDVGNNEYGNHVIKIVGNPFIHDKSSDQKRDVCGTVLNNAGGFSYPNFNVTTKGFPFIEVGDFVDFVVTDWNETGSERHKVHTCLITHRILKGIQHMTDQYSADTSDRVEYLKHGVIYLCALSGASSVEQDIKDSDEQSKYDDIDDKLDDKVSEQDVSDLIDEKLGEKTNIWNVETVSRQPSDKYALRPNTIYFVRGVICLRDSDTEDNWSINNSTEGDPDEEQTNE